jgi:hypothetical protein
MGNEMYWAFAAVTSGATAAAVAIYAAINRRHPWPMSTRIGVALGGAALGTFGGVLLCATFLIEGWIADAVTIAVATATAFEFQRRLYDWISRRPLNSALWRRMTSARSALAFAMKPPTVQRAVVCLWMSACLTLLLALASWLGVREIPSGAGAAVTNILTFALLALLAIKVGNGQRWALWLFAFVYVFGALIFVASLVFMPNVFRSAPMLAKVSAIARFALQTAALVLLFTSTSRQWFKTRRVDNAR